MQCMKALQRVKLSDFKNGVGENKTVAGEVFCEKN